MIGLDYLTAFQPLVGLSFLWAFACLTLRAMQAKGTPARSALALALLAVGGLATSYFIVFLFFYIGNNFVAAYYCFVAAVALWLAIEEGNWWWLVPGTLSALFFFLVRFEAPLFVLALLAVLLAHREVPYRVRLVVVLPLLVAMALWLSFLLAISTDASYAVLRNQNLLVLLGLFGLTAVAVLVSRYPPMERLLAAGPGILLLALAAFLVFLAFTASDHLASNFLSLGVNLINYGRWGPVWIIAAVLFTVVTTLRSGPKMGNLGPLIVIFMLIIVELGAIRSRPYRVGWGDSGNRIMLVVLPLLLFYVLVKFGGAMAAHRPAKKNIKFPWGPP